MKYQFVSDHSTQFAVDELCEALEIRCSGYYAWKQRKPSQRSQEDAVLAERIGQLHQKANCRYGYRPIYHHLQEEGMDCGRDRTLRLMRENGLKGVQSKSFKPLATNSNHCFGYSDNLLKELGPPTGPDQIWVADTTYIQTKEGWAYLATVMDLCSRRVIGWSLSNENNAALVCSALWAAIMLRGRKLYQGLIHHSDRGSTYASFDYQRLLEAFGMKTSMSGKGNCYDNAAMESFYGRYKSSSVRDYLFENIDEVRTHAFEYIEIFYNRFRKHSSLGYKNPTQFEEKFLPPMGGNQQAIPACISSN